MKTKQQIIDRVKSIKEKAVNKLQYDIGSDLRDLERELSSLPDFNPMKIDEERMTNLWERKFNKMYLSSVQKLIQEYNSTLPSPLVPLPKEMPKEFRGIADSKQSWDWVFNHYGTPSKEPLPSVEELERELKTLPIKEIDEIKQIAQHLHSKYSLHPKQEWWMKLNKGDKFMWKGQVKTFQSYEIEHKLYIEPFPSMVYCPASDCTPYTPPTAQDIIAKHGLTEEEVKVIREGK